MINISVINNSSIDSANLQVYLSAIQIQLNRDFQPIWNTTATLVNNQNPNNWRCIIKNQPDDPNDFGFHLLENNIPEARIFIQTILQSGGCIPQVISHEILEMLADPQANRLTPDNKHVVEICDPVQNTGYSINNVTVSNFVTPKYFNLPDVSNRYDFNNQLTTGIPTLLPGGYIMELVNNQWVSHFGRLANGELPYLGIHSGRSSYRCRNQNLSDTN